MAKMIPSIIDPACTSEAERLVFRKLKDDPGTQAWIVLHSLNIALHETQVKGEIDFLVIIPTKGVLCLEVKSYVRNEEGLWYYSPDAEATVRSPFKQASDAMHSIRLRLIKSHPEMKGVVFWSAVVFPFIEFAVESPEWHRWQVIDQRTINSRPVRSSLESVLTEARGFLLQRGAKWFRPDTNAIDTKDCEKIAKLLRPSFEFYESPRSRLKRTEAQLKKYTEEQFHALDQMTPNDRVIFEGPAGTGKTLLAIEAARRAQMADRKVLFLCYNKILGKWLENQTAALKPAVTTRTLHDHMAYILGITLTDTPDDVFWKEELPRKTIEKLSDPECRRDLFGEIIVDEAQDILRTNYLDVLDLSLEGGLANGKWRIFGDFATQNIYSAADISLEAFRKKRSGNATICSLRVNCRNTPRVADLAQNLAGCSLSYGKILRADDGIEPEVYFYSNRADQRNSLIRSLGKLRSEGIKNRDIVILSTMSNVRCVASSVSEQPWKDCIKPYGIFSDSNSIRYCSIYAFKGMEAPVIIITDVDSFDKPTSRSLFYVASTRVLSQVIILASEDVRRQINQALKQ